MAGATNRQYKAAGLPKATIKVIRTHGGAGMSLRSAIQVAQSHGAHVPEKALKFLERRAPEAKENPAAARMKTAKANVEMLRTQRDERRARMKSMRRKVEFARETKQIKASFTPEHQRAIDKAEGGYGPKAALRAARDMQKRAKSEIRAARNSIREAHAAIRHGQEAVSARINGMPLHHAEAEPSVRAEQFLKDASRAKAALSGVAEKLGSAQYFRQGARSERQHARAVAEGYALRDLAAARSGFERKRIAKETGVSKAETMLGPSTVERKGAFSHAKHLANRIALGERLAHRILRGDEASGKAKVAFARNMAAIHRIAPRK